MAHYAYIDKKTKLVIDVIVGKDETELIDGLDTETYYEQNTPYMVKRTSYNGNMRKNYAGIGHIYDEARDAFISPEPENATGFNEDTCRWIVPEIEA